MLHHTQTSPVSDNASYSSSFAMPVSQVDKTQIVATTSRIVDRLKHQPGALLPILHTVQDSLGCVPPEAVAIIADALNIPSTEVQEMISFYPQLRASTEEK